MFFAGGLFWEEGAMDHWFLMAKNQFSLVAIS